MVRRAPVSRGRRLRRLALLGVGFWFLLGGPGSDYPPGSVAVESHETPGLATAVPSAYGATGAWTDAGPRQDAAGHESGEPEAHADSAAEGDADAHGVRIRDVFFILIVILLSGKFLGELVERRGQPAVLGELVAGVILGGSVLGVIPDPGTEMYGIIHVFAEIGVSILLFEIGLETDLKEMFSVGRTALGGRPPRSRSSALRSPSASASCTGTWPTRR
jgi:hypothetical protein